MCGCSAINQRVHKCPTRRRRTIGRQGGPALSREGFCCAPPKAWVVCRSGGRSARRLGADGVSLGGGQVEAPRKPIAQNRRLPEAYEEGRGSCCGSSLGVGSSAQAAPDRPALVVDGATRVSASGYAFATARFPLARAPWPDASNSRHAARRAGLPVPAQRPDDSRGSASPRPARTRQLESVRRRRCLREVSHKIVAVLLLAKPSVERASRGFLRIPRSFCGGDAGTQQVQCVIGRWTTYA